MNSFIQTRDLRAVLAFAFVLSFVVGFRADASEPQTLLSWDFNTQADVDAWGKNCLSKPVAKDGSYRADYTDWDPFVVSPQFNIKPAIGQFIEIRMKSTGFHTGEVFFASSNEGQYNGFSQSKTASWDIIHDGKWHTYQIMPAWLQEPQIIKIRVDLGRPTEEELKKGANVEIDYIRILSVDFSNAAEFEKNSWTKEELDKLAVNLNADANGWESEIGKNHPCRRKGMMRAY